MPGRIDSSLSAADLDTYLTDLTPMADDVQDPILAAIGAPLPDRAIQPTVLTPGQDLLPQPSLDVIVGANIVPRGAINPDAPLRSGPGLQLPSFEELGIANLAPSCTAIHTAFDAASPALHQRGSRVTSKMAAVSRSFTGPSVDSVGPLAATLTSDGIDDISTPARRPSQVIETLTPPEDKTGVLWSTFAPGPEQSTNIALTPTHQNRSETNLRPSAATVQVRLQAQTAGTDITPRIELQRSASDYQRMPFVDRVAGRILMNIRTSKTDWGSLKVLSHALPCPSPGGFAFPAVISALQINTPGSPLCWINVFHALRKSNLSELPTSPPTTPGQPGGGNDYFTSKTFDSAVPIIDYQDNLTSDFPRSPLPVVAPESMNVSIVERYIPPTSINEFSEMFRPNGRSLLVDRLMELSPDNGTLLFIYPTFAGAQTFLQEYLAPILDPVIRMMKSINDLPLELANSLGTMSAVKAMLDYEALCARLEELCATLGRPSETMQRFSRRQGHFVLESASKETVKIERSVWTDNWWIKQEKPRIRESINKHFGKGAQTGEVTPMSMTTTLLDAVSKKQYPDGEPQAGIEVGVFIIRRSA